MGALVKIFWLLLLLVGLWGCAHISVYGLAMPPVPKKPRAPLLSPKDAANKAGVGVLLLAPPIPFTHTNILKWDQPRDNVVNVIEQQTGLIMVPWVEIGRTTNIHAFTIYSTNLSGFYRVGVVFP